MTILSCPLGTLEGCVCVLSAPLSRAGRAASPPPPAAETRVCSGHETQDFYPRIKRKSCAAATELLPLGTALGWQGPCPGQERQEGTQVTSGRPHLSRSYPRVGQASSSSCAGLHQNTGDVLAQIPQPQLAQGFSLALELSGTVGLSTLQVKEHSVSQLDDGHRLFLLGTDPQHKENSKLASQWLVEERQSRREDALLCINYTLTNFL